MPECQDAWFTSQDGTIVSRTRLRKSSTYPSGSSSGSVMTGLLVLLMCVELVTVGPGPADPRSREMSEMTIWPRTGSGSSALFRWRSSRWTVTENFRLGARVPWAPRDGSCTHTAIPRPSGLGAASPATVGSRGTVTLIIWWLDNTTLGQWTPSDFTSSHWDTSIYSNLAPISTITGM